MLSRRAQFHPILGVPKLGISLSLNISATTRILVSSILRYTSTGVMFAKAKKLAFHILPGVARPIHILWNQVIGFFFIVLALLPVPSAVRSFGKEGSGAHLALTIPFVFIMGWFGISSFWRARKISKS
jgi:hypothetical protein